MVMIIRNSTIRGRQNISGSLFSEKVTNHKEQMFFSFLQQAQRLGKLQVTVLFYCWGVSWRNLFREHFLVTVKIYQQIRSCLGVPRIPSGQLHEVKVHLCSITLITNKKTLGNKIYFNFAMSFISSEQNSPTQWKLFQCEI